VREDTGSHTAVGVAMLRAAHLLLDPGSPILDDGVILQLLAGGTGEWIRSHSFRYQTPGARALRSHVLVRSRYAEDCLAEAAARGVSQYMLLGAGLDTFAYRQPPWAAGLRIVEADHPLSQAHKRDLLARAGVMVPPNVSYLPLDLATSSLATALGESGLDPRGPVFISWLGVMSYLSPRVNRRLIREMGSLPPGSELVFTFSRKRTAGKSDTLASLAAAHGEPWLTRLDPPELESWLRDAGFSGIHFLEPEEIRRRYFSDPEITLPVPRRESIVRAMV
jgi:methyltransferase (TIGR00027 family)